MKHFLDETFDVSETYMSTLFYQKYWHIGDSDLCDYVFHALNNNIYVIILILPILL